MSRVEGVWEDINREMSVCSARMELINRCALHIRMIQEGPGANEIILVMERKDV